MTLFDDLKQKAKLVMETIRGDGTHVPLELRHLVLEALEARILPSEAGRRVFPYNQVRVKLFAQDEHQASLFRQVLADEDALKKAALERLRPPRCEKAKLILFEVEVELSQDLETLRRGFSLEFPDHRKNKGLQWRLKVLTGKANVQEIRIDKPLFYVGRSSEIFDKNGGLVRRNDLAFEADGDEIAQSVSRLHAHFKWDKRSGDLHIQDDRSAYGTNIIHAHGTSVQVPTAISAKLYPGDEIVFGKTRVKLDQVEPAEESAS